MHRIALVEDSPITRRWLCAAFRQMNRSLEAFEMAEDALEAHRAQPFDILLVDWGLPGMSGLDLCEAIRALPDGDLPVLMMVTGRDAADGLEQVLAAGADDFMSKPLSEPVLATRVRILERTAEERARRHAAEQELRAREEWIQSLQRLDALGRRAGAVAHDFNNILCLIQGSADLAALASEDVDVLENLGVIHSASLRGADLTKQLLAFGRRQPGEPVCLNASEVIAGMEPLLQRLVSHRVTLDLELGREPASVRVDAGHLEQAIMNLVINASHAMPKVGTVTVSVDRAVVPIEALAHSEGPPGSREWVRLSVVDRGVGMGPETISRVFEPFFSTRQGEGGTGLGLSIVYGIVRQYGGHITLESTLGTGTRFDIYFPEVTDEGARALGPGDETLLSEPASARVLLVEDQPDVRRITARVLRGAGYQVMEACDGLHALELYDDDAEAIDLVLSDVTMPRMSGGDLARALAEREASLPILFMSAYSEEAIEDIVDGHDAATFLPKPFDRQQLLKHVRGALQGLAH